MSRPSVLLVDDRAAVRRTVKSILAGYDCDFVEADDGESALASIATRQFDIIFLDLKLPDLSGAEILRRAREGGKSLGRIIVLTGFLEPEAIRETEELGAFRHLTKDPIDYAQVEAAFIAALADTVPSSAPPARRSGAHRTPSVPEPRIRTRPVQDARDNSRPRILVLDDQVEWLDTIGRVLGSQYAITPTTDPEDACRRARKQRFDLVILDMKLSGDLSGLDVLTRMAETTPDLRAIILTGHPGEGYGAAVESVRRGARTFVVKNQIASLPQQIEQILQERTAPPLVFLSYDRKDQSTVKRLYDRLQKRGVRPWMDTHDLVVGTEWDPKIEKVIREADHFVFCYSCHSWNKEGTLRKEFNLAMQRLPELREDRHFLIIARLDQTTVVHPFLRFTYADLFHRGGFDKLLRAISGDTKPRE